MGQPGSLDRALEPDQYTSHEHPEHPDKKAGAISRARLSAFRLRTYWKVYRKLSIMM